MSDQGAEAPDMRKGSPRRGIGPSTRSGYLRLAGVLSGALVLSLQWALSRLEPAVGFAPLELAQRFVHAAPGAVDTYVIERMGHNAQTLLALSMTLAFLLATTLLPQLTRVRGRPRPYLAGLGLAGLMALSVWADPVANERALKIVVSLLLAASYSLSLSWLIPLDDHRATSEAARRSRRHALAAIGSVTLGLAFSGALFARFLKSLVGPDTAVLLRSPDERASVPSRGAFPEIPGLTTEITSTADHYVVDIDLVDPVVEVDQWQLSVGGLVHNELALDFASLQNRFRVVEQYSVLSCVSNEVGGDLIGNSKWTGVRLRDLLARAAPSKGGVDVVFRCADGYSSAIPIELARDPSVLLAIAQNGRPLRQEHGFPCRARRRCTEC